MGPKLCNNDAISKNYGMPEKGYTCRGQNSTKVLHENEEMGRWSQTFKSGWDFYSEDQGEKKKYLAKLSEIMSSICTGT